MEFSVFCFFNRGSKILRGVRFDQTTILIQSVLTDRPDQTV